MAERKYYCYCESNCKFETMTKEQILAAIAAATGVTEIDPNAGFISKVKEMNAGRTLTFWLGTQAQYNALKERAENCLYIISNSTMESELLEFKNQLELMVSNVAYVAENAHQMAAAAIERADEAKEAAANYKIGMVRDPNVNTGMIGGGTRNYTTKSSLPKLFYLTIMPIPEQRDYSVVMEWQTIKDWCSQFASYAITVPCVDSEDVYVQAVVNHDNTVTFTTPENVYIMNVVGFY